MGVSRLSQSFPAVRVQIGLGAGRDAEELTDCVLGLREELLGLDVEAVDQAPPRQAPAKAKGLADGDVGALVITLSNSAVLVALVSVLKSWVGRDRGRKVTIRLGEDSLEVGRASDRQQDRVIEAWLERHARP